MSRAAARGGFGRRARGTTIAGILALEALSGASLHPAGGDRALALDGLSLGAEGSGNSLLVVDGPAPTSLPPGCVAAIAREARPGRAAYPLILAGPDAVWTRVLLDVAAAVEGVGDPAVAVAAREAFRRPVLDGHGFPGLVAEAQAQLGCPVACLDEYLDVLAASDSVDPAAAQDLREAVRRARDHGPASVTGPFLEDELPGIVRRPIIDGRATVGVLVAWLGEAAGPAHDAVLDELAIAAINELSRVGLRDETEARLRGDFLEELSSAPGLPRESVVRRARHLGTDVADGAVAIVGTLQDPHDAGRLIADPRLTRRFLQRAGSVIEMHWPGSFLDWSDGRVHLLLPSRGGLDAAAVEAEAVSFAGRLLAATRETVPGVALTLALSRFTPQPERLGAALEEARLAHSIGERLGRIGEVVTFEETGVYKLLFRVLADHPDELARFYEQTIAGLMQYDAARQTDLVATLATYLDNDGNLAATAGRLFTHRHTVRYRLDRIADLSGLDISRSDDREMLSLGLKAMRLLGHQIPAPAGAGRSDDAPPARRAAV